MKINIFFPFSENPIGGGNQFLKALKNYFIKQEIYSENPSDADVILFNSHHKINELIKLKKKHPYKIFIHRIDGPVGLIRKNDNYTDKLIYKINDYIADASIFQSKWSQNKNYELGIKNKKYETVIINAPNPEIFNKPDKKHLTSKKIKLIATSWSHNMIKGFKIYKWLDENLDFSKYEMTFCGNSPFQFKKIKHIKPLPSKELAKQLKMHDIFITASKNDPCSNSLIEAMHCGLPAIALNDGGHPEIIGKGGLLFNQKEEIPCLIKKIIENYILYTEKIDLPDMNETGRQYLDFIQQIFKQKTKSGKLSFIDIIKIKTGIAAYRFIKKIK
ncbi:MAG: glycosyltransferase [Bacteroidales bacterium]|nr:glycosyltransferase [Bacteroidales bacterium]